MKPDEPRARGGTTVARRVGAQIGVSGRTVERYRDKKIKSATGEHGRRLKAAVEKTWQPKVKEAARTRAATQTGPAPPPGTDAHRPPGG
ncbi:hypothetical protein [Streptomyces sp. NPDC054888]